MKSNCVGDWFDPMHCNKGKEFYKELATTQIIFFSLNIAETEPRAFMLGRQVTHSLILGHFTLAARSLTALIFREGTGFIGIDTRPHKTRYRLLANKKSFIQRVTSNVWYAFVCETNRNFWHSVQCRRNSYRYAN